MCGNQHLADEGLRADEVERTGRGASQVLYDVRMAPPVGNWRTPPDAARTWLGRLRLGRNRLVGILDPARREGFETIRPAGIIAPRRVAAMLVSSRWIRL